MHWAEPCDETRQFAVLVIDCLACGSLQRDGLGTGRALRAARHRRGCRGPRPKGRLPGRSRPLTASPGCYFSPFCSENLLLCNAVLPKSRWLSLREEDDGA